MYTNIEIEKEDPFSVTESESELFTLKTNSSVDIDCDVAVKSETTFTDFSSLENGECFIKHQIKSETITCSNNCKVETKLEIDAEKNREYVLEDPVTKCNRDHKMDDNIEILGEPWFLDRKTSSGCNNTKDGDFSPVKSSRLCSETVSEDISGKSEHSARNTTFCNGMDHLEHLKNKASYQCKTCSKRFTRLSHLTLHNFIHKGKKPLQCKTCNKNFIKLSDLKRHNLIHEDKKPFQCKTCNNSFNRLSTLKRHNLTHEDKKPFQCNTCMKSFIRLSHLKMHSFIHEDQKPYQCKTCNKSFTQLSALKVHILIHEGKKPYKCKICNKNFIQISHLKSHTISHEGKKPYQCKSCRKSFTRLSSLKRHNLTHENTKQ